MTRARPKPLVTTRTEAEVAEQVVEAARMLGIELKRRNVGGMTNAAGQYVPFAESGDADYYAILPDGRHMDLEVKHEGFDPAKLKGAKRAHFGRQLARLQETNALGGVGFWTDDAAEFLEILRHVLAGARVVEPGYGRPTVEYPETRRDDNG